MEKRTDNNVRLRDRLKRRPGSRILAALLALTLVAGTLSDWTGTEVYAAEKTTTADDDTSGAYGGLTKENAGEVWTDKTVQEGEDSDFNVTLSAMSNTTTTTTMEKEREPLDFVLVLDTSGSMGYNLDATYEYQAVSNLDERSTYYVKNSSGEYVSVSYSRWSRSWQDDSGNTYNSRTTTFYNRTIVSSRTRMEALKSAVSAFLDKIQEDNDKVTSDSEKSKVSVVTFASSSSVRTDWTTNASSAKSTVNSLYANGATRADMGLEDAEDLLSDSAVAGDGAKKVVIFFTDGEPTSSSVFEDDVAGAAVNTAKNIKDTGAIVYSLSVYPSADPSDTSSDINKFMHAVSSNYPDAKVSTSTSWWAGTTYNWDSMSLGDRAEDSNYYKKATTSEDLTSIFEEIYDETSKTTGGAPPTKVEEGKTLNDSGYVTFTDTLGDYMQVDEVTSITYGGQTYSSPTKSVDGNTTTYTFTQEVKMNARTAEDAEKTNLSYISITVTKGSDLAAGDQVEVKIPAGLIPLTIYDTKTGNTTNAAAPVSITYGVSLKDGVEKLLADGEGDGYDELVDYVKSNKADGEAYFYSNAYTKNAADGSTTATFTVADSNAYYKDKTSVDEIEKQENTTNTAANVANTEINGTDVTVFLGNNGRLGVELPVIPTEVALTGTKKLTGRDLKDTDAFSFVVKDADGKQVTTGTASGTDGKIIFEPFEVSKAGTYTYTITEVTPDDKIGGVTYSSASVEVTVTVTDNGAGKLSAAVTYPEGGAVFTNTYAPNPTTVDVTEALNAAKTLSGKDLATGEFTFTVKDEDGNVVSTGTNDAKGKITFTNEGELTFTKVGTYVYTVTEDEGSNKGITYDDTSYTVTFVVTDNLDGTLSVAKTIQKGESKTAVDAVSFSNSYAPESTTVDVTATLNATKTLSGKTLAAGEFTFQLKDSKGEVVSTGTNDAAGKITFTNKDKLTFDTVGTYTYTLTEVKGTNAGITYDASEYTVTYTVTDNWDGTLSVATAITKDGKAAAAAFSNSYAPSETQVDVTATLNATKTLSGKDLAAGEFTFQLKDSKGEVVSTGTNDADGKITFANKDKLTFDTVGIYTYTLTEVKGTNAGITYDASEYTVTYTVTDNWDGTLSVATSITKDGKAAAAAFSNSYAPSEKEVDVTATLNATKTLSGKTLEAKEFTFQLKNSKGEVVSTGTNDAAGKITFTNKDKLTFDAVGEYTYTLTEVKGSNAGIAYDASEYTVTYTVTDNWDGTLSVATSITKDGKAAAAAFSNSYAPSEKEVDVTTTVNATKKLTGKTLEANEFTFQLKDSNGKVVSTGKNAADGSISFDKKLTFKAVGEYTYTLTEVKGENAGITYDASEYTVTYTVTDNWDGTLSVATAITKDGKTAAAAFSNSYAPSEKEVDVTTTVNATKKLTGKTLEANEFTFQLKDSDGKVVSTGTNDASGSISFDKNLTFKAVGEYTYTLTEVKGTNAGITYDESVYTVTYTITDNWDGTLSVAQTIKKGDDTVKAVTFTNSYTPSSKVIDVTATLDAKKILSGKTLAANEFTFELKDSDGNVVSTGKNAADGSISFDKNLTFKAVGEYTYTVTEKNEGKGGITYDASTYTVVFTVTDNWDGSLKVTKSITKDGKAAEVLFSNSYSPNSTTVDVTAALSATKTLTGKTLNANEFTFELKDSDGNVVSTGKNAADGSISFDKNLVFSKVGEYTYTVTEKNEGKGGITYDESVYTVIFTVSDKWDGTLSVAQTIKKGDDTAEAVTFTNSYAPSSTNVDVTATLNATKTLTGKTLAANEFTFQLKNSKGEAVSTGTNDAAGKITFTDSDKLTFKQPGEYTYTLTEVKGSNAGITYDESEYTVIYTVTDNWDGTLSVATAITKDGETAAAVFSNSYAPSEKEVDVTTTVNATKKLTGKTLEANEFTFQLKDSNGKVVSTGTNDTNGKITFTNSDKLTFKTVGEYTYTLTEVKGTNAGITYDASEYTVTYTVTDNWDGSLAVTTTITKDGETAAAAFSNSYAPSEKEVDVTTTVNATKTLTGKTLEANEFTFQLKDSKGNVVSTGTNGADSKITFTNKDKLTFDAVGEYTYTLTEVKGTNAGITYDASEYTVTYTVTDNWDGSLAVTTTITKDGETAAASFNNSYAPSEKEVDVTTTVNATKKLTGKTLEADEFTFQLKDSDGKVVSTGKNAADGSIGFDKNLTFKAVGEYTYTLTEVKGTNAGITYDESVYTVIYTVTDNWDGTLSVAQTIKKGDDTVKAVTFTNSYTPSSKVIDVTATLDAKKILSGKTLAANEFTFELKDSDGNVVSTGKNAADGSISFDKNLTFKAVGEYTYTVTEKDEGKGGITYDASTYTVVFTVTDNWDGSLKVTKSITKDGKTAEVLFSNSYSPNSMTVDVTTALDAQKTLTGKTLNANEFTFELKDSDGNVVSTGKNAADGSISFDKNLVFSKVGEYTYTVTEKNEGKGGITYDESVYTVVFTVTDKWDGTLSVAQTIKKGDDTAEAVTFTNSYAPSSTNVDVTATLNATKTLSGKTLEADEFTFQLKDGDGKVVSTGTNDADGKITFTNKDKLTFDTVGTYTYTLTEVKGSNAGITYDTSEYTVTYTVTDNWDGTLSVETAITKDGKSAAAAFSNSYAPSSTTVDVTTTLNATKTLSGKTLAANDFTFEVKDSKGNVVSTGTNDANGKITFANSDKLIFSATGEYTYTVAEKNEGKGGITYDASTYTVVFTVTDNWDGTLAVAKSITKDGEAAEVTFTNTYGTDTIDSSVTDQISITKNLTGGRAQALQEGEFSFTLTQVADENGTAMSGGASQTKTNAADGSVTFDKITYSQAGTYYYQISEVDGGTTKNGITYDSNSYIIKTTVTDDGEGHLSAEHVRTDGLKAIVFTNTYDSSITYTAAGGLQLSKTLTGHDMDAEQFTFTITAKDEASAAKAGMDTAAKTANVSNTAAADGEAAITSLFSSMSFDMNDAGKTYTYTITENGPAADGYTYDTETATVTITATDDNLGVMTVTTTVQKGDGETATYIGTAADPKTATVAFVNSYAASGQLGGDSDVKIEAAKTLTGRDLIDQEFTFTVTDAKGTEAATGTNDANGAITFTAISYTTESLKQAVADGLAVKGKADGKDTYTFQYTVAENTDGLSDKGITAEASTFSITVTVTDNEDGTLTPAVTYPEGTDKLTFVNTYQAEDASLSINGQKKLELQYSSLNKKIGDIAGLFTFTLTGEDGAPMPDKTTAQNDESGNVSFGSITYTLENVFGDSQTDEPQDGEPTDTDSDQPATDATDAANAADGTDAAGKAADGTTAADKTADGATAADKTADAAKNTGAADSSAAGTTDDTNTADGSAVGTAEDTNKADSSAAGAANTADGTAADSQSVESNEVPLVQTAADDDASKSNADAQADADASKAGTEAQTDADSQANVAPQADGDAKANVDPQADGQTANGVRTKTFTYTITESGSVAGITNDTAVMKTFTVTVTDDGKGHLTAVMDGDGAMAFSFTNTYSAEPVTSSVTDQIELTKTLIGREMKAGEFSFELKSTDGKNVATGTNTAEGTVAMSSITFTEPGVYTYRLSEKNTGRGGMTYDGTVYDVTAKVTDADGKLSVEWTLAKNGAVQTSAEFVNTYKAAPTTVAFTATKKLIGRTLYAGWFDFDLKNGDGKLLQTKKNQKDGSILFDAITYDKAGVYEYTISEEKGYPTYYTYDTTVYTITVTVTDNGEGSLSASVDTHGGSLTFTNLYDAPSRPDTNKKGSNTNGTGTVQTGDEAPVAQLVLLAAAALIVIAVVVVLMKKKQNEQKEQNAAGGSAEGKTEDKAEDKSEE